MAPLALGLVGALVLGSIGRGIAPPRPGGGAAGWGEGNLTAQLVVPSRFAPGVAANLSVVWSGPSGCGWVPAWTDWAVPPSLGGGPVDGGSVWLADPLAAQAAGNVTIRATAAAVERCGGGETAVTEALRASVPFAFPLRIEGVPIETERTTAGNTTVLRGRLVGGVPPFMLTVQAGTGAEVVASFPHDGPFAVPLQLPDGCYPTRLLVQDGTGAEDTVTGPTVEVGGGPGPRLWLEGAGASAGSVATVRAIAGPGGPLQQVVWSSTGRIVALAANGTEAELSFATPGWAWVNLSGTNAAGDRIDGALALVVAPALDLAALSNPNGTVRGVVEGGVPPFSVTFGNVTATLVADGSWALRDPKLPAAEEAPLSIVDAAGDTVRAKVAVAASCPPQVSWSWTDVVGDASEVRYRTGPGPLYLAVAAAPGVADADWLAAVDRGSGSLTDTVTLGNGTAAAVLTLAAWGPEDDGPVWVRTVAGQPLPLSVRLWANASAHSGMREVAATVIFHGGLPPYTLTVAPPNTAPLRWSIPSSLAHVVWAAPSFAAFRWTVSDALNQTLQGVSVVGPALSGSLPPETLSLLGLAGVGGGLACAAASASALRRWRRRSPPSRRRIRSAVAALARSRGTVDRATLELSVEEGGLPWALVAAEVDRLVEEGQLERCTEDGEERLRWVGEGRQ